MRRSMPIVVLAFAALAGAQKIPTPKEFLGFDVCQDYHLANYRQLSAYWHELDRLSDRLTVESIGKTEDGRDQFMCVITDPSNRRNLEGYRRASGRLARAKDFKNDEDARNFAKRQKAVVWIDGGLHANEVLVAQHLIEMAFRMVTQNDLETKRILKDTILLLAHANPDGNDWVVDHYMRRKDPETRSAAGLPFLYQKYIGHDNNRDFYANNMAETRNINRILYNTWYPQIVYNHHQSAPAGTIMFVPPFRNPFNYHMDPMTAIATDLVGTHMHQRMISEGKRGTAMRGSTLYSTWWNGGLRTTTYFHNMVGILTETWGSPNPGPLPFVQRFQIPSTDVPFPVEAGKVWHLRDSLEYEISANFAILDYASRYRERLLFDFYRAGRNQIEMGSRDTWSRYPARIAAGGAESLKKPENRDARMYVIPYQERDFPTSLMFAHKLAQCGVEIYELTSAVGKWANGSLVIPCNQAFRPHILDMFEPQDHPNDFQYPGGPPIPPYDNAGYTLAFQMGVEFERILEPMALPLRRFALGLASTHEELGSSVGRDVRDDCLTSPVSQNQGATLANLALRKGFAVEVGTDKRFNVPTYFVSGSKDGLVSLAREVRPSFLLGASKGDLIGAQSMTRPRVALWDRYGGSMESGWSRWVLEQFAFQFDVVFPPDLDQGDLNAKYDCIIFPDGAIPAPRGMGVPPVVSSGVSPELGGETGPLTPQPPHPAIHRGEGAFGQGGGGQGQQNLADDPTIPYVYRRRIGSITAKTIDELRKFVENGGHLLCIGSSALNIARQFKLPIASDLVDEKGNPLPSSVFYIPGSVLRVKLNPGPLTLGMNESVDVMFDNSPVFRSLIMRREPGIIVEGDLQVVAYFDSDKPLRSGWAWGQEILKDKAAVVDVPLGKGRVVLYGPEILFRGQSHGTFKLLFNAIFRSSEQQK